MALPQDMQTVPVILLKKDIKRLDKIVKEHRFRSRSILMRSLIERGLNSFSLPTCSVERACETSEEQRGQALSDQAA